MPTLEPVDHDPFAAPQLTPVDHDPFDPSQTAFGADIGYAPASSASIVDSLHNLLGSFHRPPQDPNDPVIFHTASPLVNITQGDIDAGIKVAMSAGPGTIGGKPGTIAGIKRNLPDNNYIGPISKHTDTLYREMHPSDALADLPTSNTSSSNPMGNRKFYADHPDLALGQNGNSGVRIAYDSAPFVGKINTQKPTWQLGYQNGTSEYMAEPVKGANIRDAVKSIEVDKSSLSRVEKAQYDRIIANLQNLGWSIADNGKKITAQRPN